MLVMLGSVIGAALIVAAVAYARRSRKSEEPIQLGVGRKLRPVGVQAKKEKTVTYAVRLLFVNVPRLFSGAVFVVSPSLPHAATKATRYWSDCVLISIVLRYGTSVQKGLLEPSSFLEREVRGR